MHETTTTSAVRRAPVASARAAPRSEKQQAQWRARVLATPKPAVRWRPQLARRSTVLRRWRETFRRCSGFVWGTGRLQPARHRTCASQARVLRLLPIDSECSGALACAPRESRLCVGGRSWHDTARTCAEGETPLTGAVALYGVRTDYNQPSTAHVLRKLACCVPSL